MAVGGEQRRYDVSTASTRAHPQLAPEFMHMYWFESSLVKACKLAWEVEADEELAIQRLNLRTTNEFALAAKKASR